MPLAGSGPFFRPRSNNTDKDPPSPRFKRRPVFSFRIRLVSHQPLLVLLLSQTPTDLNCPPDIGQAGLKPADHVLQRLFLGCTPPALGVSGFVDVVVVV